MNIRPIPEGAAPIYRWNGARSDLFTYWGKQNVRVEAAAWLPPDWAKPGDGFWRVKALNAEGKPLPFLGVIRRFTNETGAPSSVIVPEVPLARMPAGLYVVIDPNVTLENGQAARIRPLAYVLEIRNGYFMPFRVKVPLFPERESPLTPAPEPLPETPAGTPVSVD